MLNNFLPKNFKEIINIKDINLFNNYSLEGFLNKKGKNLFTTYNKRYFRFFDKGRFLVYFNDNDINNTEIEIKGIYRIEDIKTICITDNDEFKIVMNENELILRAENSSIKEKWVNAWNYFIKMYKLKNKEINKIDKLNYNIYDIIKIRSEIELENKNILKYDNNFIWEFLKDKNLYSILENVNINNLMRRMFISKIEKKTISNEIIKENIDIFNLDNTKYFLFLISNLPIRNLEEQSDLEDFEVLNEDILPEGIKFNILYLFKYKGKGDISGVHKFIDIEEIYNWELIEKDNFTKKFTKYDYSFNFVRIKNSKKTFISTKYAYLTNIWIQLINKCMSNLKNNKFTKLDNVKINIEPFIYYFENLNINDFKNFIKLNYYSWFDFNKTCIDITGTLNKLLDIMDKLNHKMDAIFCRRSYLKIY